MRREKAVQSSAIGRRQRHTRSGIFRLGRWTHARLLLKDGSILWDFDTVGPYKTVNGVEARGGSTDGGGAAIASGMVFVNSGYVIWGGMPGNVLLAFSVDGK
jgi:hypothetical protein